MYDAPLGPGQISAQLGVWAGSMREPFATHRMFESMAMLSVTAPISARLAPRIVVGAHRHHDGDLDLRDAVIGLGWSVVSTDELVLKLEPGLNLPIGSAEEGLAFTPLSTGSVDPYLQAELVYGSRYLIGSTASVRAPLYPGTDGSRAGVFGRVDVWAARRWGEVVPWVGLSGVGLAASDPAGFPPAFAELAAVGGAVVNVGRRYSVMGQVRVPVPEAATRKAVRGPAVGLSVSAVIGGKAEEEHHEGDGHDHG